MLHSKQLVMQKLLNTNAHLTLRAPYSDRFVPYLYGLRNEMVIIDLENSLISLRRICHMIGLVIRARGHLLFVNSNSEYNRIIQSTAFFAEQSYINHKWIGGLLTNWSHMQNVQHHFQTCLAHTNNSEKNFASVSNTLGPKYARTSSPKGQTHAKIEPWRNNESARETGVERASKRRDKEQLENSEAVFRYSSSSMIPAGSHFYESRGNESKRRVKIVSKGLVLSSPFGPALKKAEHTSDFRVLKDDRLGHSITKASSGLITIPNTVGEEAQSLRTLTLLNIGAKRQHFVRLSRSKNTLISGLFQKDTAGLLGPRKARAKRTSSNGGEQSTELLRTLPLVPSPLDELKPGCESNLRAEVRGSFPSALVAEQQERESLADCSSCTRLIPAGKRVFKKESLEERRATNERVPNASRRAWHETLSDSLLRDTSALPSDLFYKVPAPSKEAQDSSVSVNELRKDTLTRTSTNVSVPKFESVRTSSLLRSFPRFKKMQKCFEGLIAKQLPDCIIVLNASQNSIAIHEAKQLRIPIISLVDSNTPHELYQMITYPIPANDESVKFVYFFCNCILKTILLSKNILQDNK